MPLQRLLAALLAIGALLVLLAPQIARADTGLAVHGDTTRREPVARVEGAPVSPGAIATMPVTIPVPLRSTGSGAVYHVHPFPGVRLFSDTTGVIAGGTDSVTIAVTYTLARSQPVGAVRVARLFVEWRDGTTWEADLAAQVQPRFGFRIALEALPDGARDAVLVRWVVANTGNSTDTVQLHWDAGYRWRVNFSGLPIVVQLGQPAQGTVAVEWPHGTPPGDARLLQLTASGRSGSATASVLVTVPYPDRERPGLVAAQSMVFLGSTVGQGSPGRPAMAIRSEAQVTPDTRVSVAFRHSGSGPFARAFFSELLGQQLRLTMVRPGLSVGAGDVFRVTTALMGTVSQGSGVDADWHRGRLNGSLMLARGGGTSTQVTGDHVAHASAGTPTRFGDLAATLTAVNHRPRAGGDTTGAFTAGLRWRSLPSAPYRVAAELGLMHLSAVNRGAATGIAADLNGEATVWRAMLYGRAHRVPSTLPSGEIMPSNALVGGTLPFTDLIAALGSASTATTPVLGERTRSGRGAALGIQVTPWNASAQLLQNMRVSTGPSGTALHARSTSMSATAPVGALLFDVSGEFGTSESADSLLPSRFLRAGARWTNERGWLGASFTSARVGSGGADARLEATGAADLRGASIEFGAAVGAASRRARPVSEGAVMTVPQSASWWTRVALPTRFGTQLVLGAEYGETMAGRPGWRMSLGLARAVDVPLPIRAQPVVSGVVFLDANANGVRDAGETGVEGVVVTVSQERRRVGPTGEFMFMTPDLRGRQLEVDASTLAEGYIIPPGFHPTALGRVDVPVVAAAELSVVLRAEQADGTVAEAIEPAENAVVTIAAADGRKRDAAVVNGVATFDGVMPGEYRITVQLPAIPGRGAETREAHVSVPPGARQRTSVGVPPTRRMIRFGPAASGPAPQSLP